MKLVTLLLVVIFLSACEDPPSYLSGRKLVINMAATTQDVSLPPKLWEELESVYRPLALDLTQKTETDSKAKLEIPTDFFAFHVYLVEKTKGVLKKGNVDLQFGKGGGVLNLEDFVNDEKRGTFYLGLQPNITYEKSDVFKVFYLSNAKKVKIDGEEFGSGCGHYLEITDFYGKAMKTDGLLLNTSGARYVSQLVGSYFMAVSVKGKLNLSQLTILDSRHKNQHCNWKIK